MPKEPRVNRMRFVDLLSLVLVQVVACQWVNTADDHMIPALRHDYVLRPPDGDARTLRQALAKLRCRANPIPVPRDACSGPTCDLPTRNHISPGLYNSLIRKYIEHTALITVKPPTDTGPARGRPFKVPTRALCSHTQPVSTRRCRPSPSTPRARLSLPSSS